MDGIRPIRVLIVDDEPMGRRGIMLRLRDHDDMALIGESANGQEAATLINTLKPDLVFLDIEMPGSSGIDALRSLPTDSRPCVIFVTAHERYAVEAFGLRALDYLLKPFEDERFADALDRVRHSLFLGQQEMIRGSDHRNMAREIYKERFTVRQGERVCFIPAGDIDWIEAVGDYVELHVGSESYLLRKTLRTLSSQLDPQEFLRVHRSAVVRVDRLSKVKALPNRDYQLTLRNGTTLRASRTYTRALLNLIRS